jgi:hypothetical protein
MMPIPKPTGPVKRPPTKPLAIFEKAMKEELPTIPTTNPLPAPDFSQEALYRDEPPSKKQKEDDKETGLDSYWAEKEILGKDQLKSKKTTPMKLELVKLKTKWTFKYGGLDLPGRRELYQSSWGWKLMSPKKWWDWSENEVTREVEHQITKETIIQHVERNIMAGNIPTDIELVIIS